MKKLAFLFFWALLTLPVLADHLMIVTEDLPPYNYLDNGKPTGLSTEVVETVLARTGHNPDIQFLPWARAYQIALTQPNTLIYSIARTGDREELFAWVGTIAPFGASLYQRAKAPRLKLQSLSDARVYQVGVYRGDVKESFLRANGFVNLQTTEDDRLNLRKLMLGRIDLIAIDDSVLISLLKKEGIDPMDIRRVMPIDDLSGNLYMAFNKDTPKDLVDTFRKGLEDIKADGTFEQILRKYLLVN